MTAHPGILADVAALAGPVLAMDPSAITPETPLRDRVDSLAMIDLVVAAEDAFGVRIPDEDAERFETVGDVVDFISRASCLPPPGGESAPEGRVGGERRP